MVGQVPHRIQGLLGGTGGDGDPDTGQVLLPGNGHRDGLYQGLRLRQLAGAHILAGQHPHGGVDDGEAVAAQGRQVFLSGGIFQHGGVHGRGNELGAPGGQYRGGQHIVRQTVGQFRNDVGGCRGNEDHIRRLGKGHMGHIVLEIPGEGVHHAAVVGQGLEGKGGNEFGGVFRHDHVGVCPHFSQGAGYVGHFIGGNASGDPQKHAFSV